MKLVIYAAAAAALVAAGSADATTIYSNGPKNGTINAYVINANGAFTFEIADSFTSSGTNFATSMSFETWDFSSANAATSVGWEIWNGNPFGGGTELYSGTASVTSNWDGFAAVGGYSLYSNSISFGSSLDVSNNCGGQCWILLGNAVDQLGDTVYWDENNGPSSAAAWDVTDSKSAPIAGSETFTIFGSTPEPATWALMMAGFAGLGAALRTRRKPAAI
jgi:hypothetical protein